jgi:Flp pilus assembly protein TadG
MDREAPVPQQRAWGLPGPRKIRNLARSERGTAVVEFALVAPILFALVFGILEFGRVLNAYNNMTQLAGQGARAAAVNRNPDGTAVGAGAVDNTPCENQAYSIQCQLAGFYAKQDSLSNVKVCIVNPNSPTPITTGSPLTVHVTYTYNFSEGLLGFSTIPLSATQTERAEAPPSYAVGVDQNGQPCS